MTPYRRPEFPSVEYLDEAGAPIPYGSRWKHSPPEDAYSRVSHPERYAPVQRVADAILSFLVRNFDVTVEEDPADARELPWGPVLRSVRLIPADPNSARLTVFFTDFPGIFVRMGAFSGASFPSCGCDACDDSVDGVIDDLEQRVFAVVRGGLAERVVGDDWTETRLDFGDRGNSQSGSAVEEEDQARVPAMRAELDARTSDGGAPWPRRAEKGRELAGVRSPRRSSPQHGPSATASARCGSRRDR